MTRFLTRALMATFCMLILVLPAMATNTPSNSGLDASRLPAATATIKAFATKPNTAFIDAEKLQNSWQPAPGYETPRMLMTNMGTEQLYTFQGHDLSSLTNRGDVGSILYAPCEADSPIFRADVAACSGATVDYFDARAGTPDVALLAAYDCVMVWVYYPCADNVLFGDNLATYVDGGGKVILGWLCYPCDQNAWLAGRIMTEAYCPVTVSTGWDSGAYNNDGIDCVNGLVSDYDSLFLDRATLVPGASSDGTFNNGSNSLAVAWRADRSVYFSPGNTGGNFSPGGTEQWAQLVCNMAMCSGGSSGWGILYAPSGPDNPAFRAELAAGTGLNVDYYDASLGTPTVSELSGYTCVFTWADNPYADNVLFGDNLAAYVDGVGKVILGQGTYPSDQNNFLAGAIMTADYCPVTTSTSFDSGAYNNDGTDCVHDGVSAYDTTSLDVATPIAGALSDGTFNNVSNSLAVAWRADRSVYYSPGNTGGASGTGDWAQLICNMVSCADVTYGDILYAPSRKDNPTFRAELAACSGMTVDYFAAAISTPDVALLSNYDCVFTWVDFPYADNVLFGDNLAAYVDAGGKVILGQWCLPTGFNYLSGAIMGPAYCPTTGIYTDSGVYNGDGTDCVHDGVGAYASDFLDVATLVAGASSDGTFNNPSNSLAVAWRADRMVYSSPGNTGGVAGTGDWAQLVCNMALCGGGSEPMTMPLIITGPGNGAGNPPQVRVWDPNDSMAMYSEWAAYGAEDYGVNVACGDLDGDGYDSVVTGPGPGAIFGPHVRAFDYMGVPVDGVNLFAYGTLKYGVNVACGDVDGDGMDEIITGPGPGAVFGPHVRGWNVDGGTAESISGINSFVYGTLKWGANVACGDIDGDGYDEIVTGAGPGAVFGPHVRGWDVDGGSLSAISAVSYFAYGTLKYGVNVGCADIDGDGIDEILTGAGPGSIFGPQVRGWNYDGGTVESLSGVNFFAYDGVLYGAQVAGIDLDGDGFDEILTMPGPDMAIGAQVRAWNVDGGTAEWITDIDADAYSDLMLLNGGKVDGGYFMPAQ